MLFLKNLHLIIYVFSFLIFSYQVAFFKKKHNSFKDIVFIFLIIISFFSIFIFILILFEKINFEYIYIFNIIFCLIPFIFYKKTKDLISQSFTYIHNEKLYFFVFYFITLYLITLLPVSDPDSLDYHLGAPKQWILNGSYQSHYNWLHYQLSSYGEVINAISLISFDGKLLGFLKVTLLIFLTTILLINNPSKKFIIKLFLVSPIFIFFILSQKPQFFGFLILCILLVFLFKKDLKNIDKLTHFSFIFLTGYVSAINFSFLPLTLSLLSIYVIYCKNIIFKYKFFSIISFILFFITIGIIYLKNFYFHGNLIAPFFENIFSSNPKQQNINFANYLQSFGYNFNFKNLFLLPVRFFIPLSLSDITYIFSPIFLFVFFIKELNQKSKVILIALLISIFVMILTSQLSNRYYFLTYFLLLLYLLECSFKNSYFLIKISRSIFVIFTLSLFIYFVANSGSLFSKKKEIEYLSKYAYQYDEILWLKEKISKDNNFTSDIRSKSLLEENHFTSHYLFYLDKSNLKKEIKIFVDKNNIKFFSFVKNDNRNFFYKIISNCKEILYSKNFTKKRRNFLAPDQIITREIFKLDLTSKKCEIK